MFETRVIRQLNVTAKDDIIFIFILPTRSNIYTAVWLNDMCVKSFFGVRYLHS